MLSDPLSSTLHAPLRAVDAVGRSGLGPELRAIGVVGLVGIATAASYDTGTGDGNVTRGADGSNQSFVKFSGLSAASTYQVAMNTGAGVSLWVRSGTQGGTVALVVTPSTVGARGSVVSPVGGEITITASSTGTSAFTALSVRKL